MHQLEIHLSCSLLHLCYINTLQYYSWLIQRLPLIGLPTFFEYDMKDEPQRYDIDLHYLFSPQDKCLPTQYHANVGRYNLLRKIDCVWHRFYYCNCCHYCHPNSLVNLLCNSRITRNVKCDSKTKLKLFVE